MKNDIESKIDGILNRGVGEFIDPDGLFRKKLVAKARGEYNKDIVIKYGVDPTRPDIHLGHAVCFRKLRQLQDLGCKIVFLVGDYTAMIGDPTGKSQTRPEIGQAEVEQNMGTYLAQIDRILNINPNVFTWIRNSDWFVGVTDIAGDLNFLEKSALFERSRMQITHLGKSSALGITLLSILRVLRHITFAQLKEREMFKERIKNGKDLYMHEMLYPVFQGIDSLMINKIYGSCDIEIGGTDQTFNMLMGRDVQKNDRNDLIKMGFNTDQQAVLSLKLLEGTDGNEKMSKSLDNYIGITEEPNLMFGKVMSIPDSSMLNYYELCTELSLDDAKKNIANNPRDAKVILASEIVKIYHGQEKANEAEHYFIQTFSKRETPEDVRPSQAPEEEEVPILDFMISEKLASSKGDARRKIEQGGVSIDGEKVITGELILTSDLHDGKIMKVGKINFVRIKFKR